MTVRVLRPVLTITTAVAVLVAALAVYAFMSAGDTHADSAYNPQTKVFICNKLPAAFSSTDAALAEDAFKEIIPSTPTKSIYLMVRFLYKK